MLSWFGKLMPFRIVEWLVKDFSHQYAVLEIGDKKIKGKFWATGADEGFFISNLTEMKELLKKQEGKLEEYRQKVEKLELEEKKEIQNDE